jgi:predicted transcriptional regulator of viral defense system
MKYREQVEKAFKNQPIFKLRDVKTLLSKEKTSTAYLHLMIHQMLKKRQIHKITQGIYSFQEDPTNYGFAFTPFYYGLQNALSLQNIGTQETNPVIITPRKVRLGIRNIGGTNFILHRIQRKLFFGYQFIKYYDIEIPVSDLEKTLLDFIYYRQPLNTETIEELTPRLNTKKLAKYIQQYPKKIQTEITRKLGQLAKKGVK